MSAVIPFSDFRLYQSARDYGQRVGIPQREAVREVASAKRAGMTARVPVAQLAHRAMRQDSGPQPPSAA